MNPLHISCPLHTHHFDTLTQHCKTAPNATYKNTSASIYNTFDQFQTRNGRHHRTSTRSLTRAESGQRLREAWLRGDKNERREKGACWSSKKEENACWKRKKCGEAGDRNLGLPQFDRDDAKRALYHWATSPWFVINLKIVTNNKYNLDLKYYAVSSTADTWWIFAGTIKFAEVPQHTWNITHAADSNSLSEQRLCWHVLPLERQNYQKIKFNFTSLLLHSTT